MMAGATPYLLSIAVLALFALVVGGVRLIIHGEQRAKGVLMLVAALVLLGNLWLWSLPLPAGSP